MRESIRNLSIGLVSLVGLAGLAVLLLAFGEFTSAFERRYPIDVALNAAGGLRQGSLVTLYGVPIGLVERISLESSDPLHPVRVRSVIDRTARIPNPAAPVVESSLLGSGARLELCAGPASAERAWYEPQEVPLLFGEYRAIDERLLSALDERLGDIRGAFDSFKELSRTYVELGRNLNELVGPVEDGADPATSLRVTIARANGALLTADDALKLAREWLGDEALRADVRSAVRKANELIERSTDAVSVIAGLASNLDADREAIVRRLLPVFDEASLALQDVRRVITIAAEGRGTVGRLLNDPQLYEDLADSAKRLSRAMEAIQAVAEKLRAEGIVIQF